MERRASGATGRGRDQSADAVRHQLFAFVGLATLPVSRLHRLVCLHPGPLERSATHRAVNRSVRVYGSMHLPSGRNCDHPPDAEAVGEHAEARRPKGLRERHPDLTAIREGGKRALGFGLVGHR